MMEDIAQIKPRQVKVFMDRKMNAALEKIGLTATCGPFLLEIQENEGINMAELTSKVMVDKALTTRNVKTLIDSGFAINTCN